MTGPSVPGEHTDGNGIIIDDFQSTQTAGFPNYTFPTLVENNLTFGNGAKGIHVTWSDFVTVRGNSAAFNNLDNLNSGTWRGELSNQQSSKNTWEDNIAVTNPAFNLHNTAIGNYSYGGYVNENVVWENNLTFNGTPGAASFRIDGGNAPPLASMGNLLGVDPMFLNAAAFDFRLSPDSAAPEGRPRVVRQGSGRESACGEQPKGRIRRLRPEQGRCEGVTGLRSGEVPKEVTQV